MIELINKGVHLDLDTWIVPGQILTGKPPPGSGKQLQTSRYQGVDLSRSSQHPTAIPGGAEFSHDCMLLYGIFYCIIIHALLFAYPLCFFKHAYTVLNNIYHTVKMLFKYLILITVLPHTRYADMAFVKL